MPCDFHVGVYVVVGCCTSSGMEHLPKDLLEYN